MRHIDEFINIGIFPRRDLQTRIRVKLEATKVGMQDRIQNIAKKKKGKGEEEGKEVDDATGVEVEDIQEDEKEEEEEGAETSLPPANGEVRKRRSRRAPMAKPERDEVAFIDEGAAEEDGRAAGEDRTATGVETAVTGN